MRKIGLFLVILAIFFLLPGCTSGKLCPVEEGGLASGFSKGEGRLHNQGDATCKDRSTGKVWQMVKSKRIGSLAEANQYIKELRLAGYNDWRLPSLAELYELFLLYDQQGRGDCPMDFAGNYWSGDADQKGRVGAWELDGDCHPEREYVPKKAGYVRAVRP